MIATDAPAANAASVIASKRVASVDALRGLVIFTMIFVNDIAGVTEQIVPGWMRHYHGKSGMTFVDLVFPAFLFIVGMSIPFALGARLAKGEPLSKIVLHVATRTLALLFIGIMMVNESPDSNAMGWSATLWSVLMYSSAILAFCALSPRSSIDGDTTKPTNWRLISLSLRVLGLSGLVILAFAFRGENSRRIVSLSPFSIHTDWYGILGLIGWPYLVSCVVFLIFRGHRTALVVCMVLLVCLYPADRRGAFEHFWLARFVGIGETLGSLAAITVGGMLLASILLTPQTAGVWSRTRFTLLFIAACSAGALLFHRLYGINKNNATPSWCLWACAITAALWLVFYFLTDVRPISFVTKPLSIAGQNVLLAYLISEMLPSLLRLVHLGNWYSHLAEPNLVSAIGRSAGCAVAILSLTAFLNRVGFRLRLELSPNFCRICDKSWETSVRGLRFNSPHPTSQLRVVAPADESPPAPRDRRIRR